MDLDPQGSSTRWLKKRTPAQPAIHGIAGYERNARVTRTFAMRIPLECERVIVDTAAALDALKLPETTRSAIAILVPVLPSDIDIHAAATCIRNLLLVARIHRSEQRIGVIANRVKKNTVIYRSLMRFLETLQIPVVATLRDSQSYIRSAETGEGIFEMKNPEPHEDLESWTSLITWLEMRAQSMQPAADTASAPVRKLEIVADYCADQCTDEDASSSDFSNKRLIAPAST
jgi:chromosome partitioning protein